MPEEMPYKSFPYGRMQALNSLKVFEKKRTSTCGIKQFAFQVQTLPVPKNLHAGEEWKKYEVYS